MGMGVFEINTLTARNQFFTKLNDTNVTLTITDAVNTHLFTLGWEGTLAASRLNEAVVQAVVDDTNITGVITAQSLTLGFTGTLAASRLNDNVVQAVVNDTNITGSIAVQALTLGWAGTLAESRLAVTTVVAASYGSATTSPTYTVSATGRLTAAADVTITPAASSITSGQALTKTDDTNITLTLGGSPTTALLAAASITLGFTGTLSGARGGTGVANTGLTITLAGNLVTTGAFNTTLVQGATVSLTLPLATSTLLVNNLGLASGSILIGGTAASEALTLKSTSHATKGLIVFGNSAYDEVNNRLGIGTTTPGYWIDNKHTDATAYSSSDFDQSYNFIRCWNADTTVGSAVGLLFIVGSNRDAAIQAVATADGAAALTFGTRGGGSRLERMRLDSTGLLDVKGIITSLLGTSTGTMPNIGVANIQTASAGIGNAADTTDDTLFTYSLPLNAMSANGKSLRTIATGHFATNANSKQVKFWVAGTVILDSTVMPASNTDWDCEIDVTRIDSTHVSCRGRFYCPQSTVADVITATPNLVVADLTTTVSIVKITGASTIAGAANDVLGYLMKTWFEN